MNRSILTLAEVEREHVLNVLRLCGYNRTHAASALGISIRGLRMKLHEYGSQGIPVPPPKTGLKLGPLLRDTTPVIDLAAPGLCAALPITSVKQRDASVDLDRTKEIRGK